MFLVLITLGSVEYKEFEQIYNCKEASLLVIYIIFVVGEGNWIYDSCITQNIFYKFYCSSNKSNGPYFSGILSDKL